MIRWRIPEVSWSIELNIIIIDTSLDVLLIVDCHWQKWILIIKGNIVYVGYNIWNSGIKQICIVHVGHLDEMRSKFKVHYRSVHIRYSLHTHWLNRNNHIYLTSRALSQHAYTSPVGLNFATTVTAITTQGIMVITLLSIKYKSIPTRRFARPISKQSSAIGAYTCKGWAQLQ